jgi:hypothetical protein
MVRKDDWLLRRSAALLTLKQVTRSVTTALQKGNPSALTRFVEAFAIWDLPSTERVRNFCPQGS